ncbi:MAG: type II secretion system F family protein [Candidatus Babeliales bacterium]|jgi:type II secretory pathway component PulF
MPLYQYDSFNRRGDRVRGTIEAVSPQVAKETLQGQGLLPTQIVEIAGEKSRSWVAGLFEKKVDQKTVILFTRQLGVLLKSAVPLLQALELLAEQFDGRFRRVLISIKDGIKSGEPFAKELSRYPKIFSNVYVQLVRAGEATGKLDIILSRLTNYLERAEETKKAVRKAMTYPILMLSFSILVVVGLLVGLVPRLQSLFEQTGQALPGPTKLLLAMSNFVQSNMTLLSVILVGALIFFLYVRTKPKGKYRIDELLLRLPITSYFSRTKAIVQFSKTLGMLLESGVNLSDALDIVCNIVDNKVLTQQLQQARTKIIKEGKIAKYLKETNIFPTIASYMINTGEQSGKLAEMLLTVGNDYDVELQERTEGLTAAISPVMTIVMAVVIGFIMISIFLPIMGMADLSKI